MSTHLLNTSRDRDSTIALGSPFQCLFTFSTKKFFLNLNQASWTQVSSMPWNMGGFVHFQVVSQGISCSEAAPGEPIFQCPKASTWIEMQPRMGMLREGEVDQHHEHSRVTEIGLLVLNQFPIQTMLEGFTTRELGSPWSDHFLRLKIATDWSQTVVNLDLLGPGIQIQFSTFIKKAYYLQSCWTGQLPTGVTLATGHWASLTGWLQYPPPPKTALKLLS